jgi:hypothetical protein
MGGMILLWAAAGLLLMMGALALLAALRGRRIDDHPLCRHCRFDLVGIHGREPRCPECGSDLGGRRPVRWGNRRRRGKLFVTGAVLLAAGLAPMAILASGRAAGVDWNRHKPEWWLGMDAHSGRRPVFDAAMEEFDRRLRDGRLSRQRALELVELALGHQGDPAVVWCSAAGDYLESARLAGLFSPEHVERYARQGVRVSVRLLRRPMEASPWMFEIVQNRRFAPRARMASWIEISLREVNHRQVRTLPLWGSYHVGGAGIVLNVASCSDPSLLGLAPGEHALGLGAYLRVEDADGATLHRWEQEFTVMCTVVPPLDFGPGDDVELLTDESLRQAMEAALELSDLRLHGSSVGGVSGSASVLIRHPPADAAFDIYWSYPDPGSPDEVRELRMGGVCITRGMLGESAFAALLPPTFLESLPARVDVIFRPSRTQAARDRQLKRIWDGEIAMHGLPLLAPANATEEPAP